MSFNDVISAAETVITFSNSVGQSLFSLFARVHASRDNKRLHALLNERLAFTQNFCRFLIACGADEVLSQSPQFMDLHRFLEATHTELASWQDKTRIERFCNARTLSTRYHQLNQDLRDHFLALYRQSVRHLPEAGQKNHHEQIQTLFNYNEDWVLLQQLQDLKLLTEEQLKAPASEDALLELTTSLTELNEQLGQLEASAPPKVTCVVPDWQIFQENVLIDKRSEVGQLTIGGRVDQVLASEGHARNLAVGEESKVDEITVAGSFSQTISLTAIQADIQARVARALASNQFIAAKAQVGAVTIGGDLTQTIQNRAQSALSRSQQTLLGQGARATSITIAGSVSQSQTHLIPQEEEKTTPRP